MTLVAGLLGLVAVLALPLAAKLVPMGEEQALAEASLVVHARLLGEPVPVGSAAVFLAACLETAKGAASPTVRVACSLCPPCLPDRIEQIPEVLRKGAEVILFLARPDQASGPWRIVGQWEGPGLRPFTREAWQAIREAVRRQP